MKIKEGFELQNVCGEHIIAKHAKEKVLFYSCISYPKCDFSTWDRPLDENCPDCGKMLY